MTDTAIDRYWQQWLDWAEQNAVIAPADPRTTAARASVWDGSEYVAVNAARHPAMLAELLASGDLDRAYAGGEIDGRLATALEAVTDEPGLQSQLRRFRRREMVRIIWRDLAGWANLDETLEDLSALADASIQHALSRLTEWTRAELGTPTNEDGEPQSMLVIGMGKLGARELNLSSDIDLIFAYPAAGEVEGGPRPLTNEQFFTRLGQRLVQALGNQTVDGFVFRVDTRLRPFGDAGPLVMSFDAMEAYYHAQAREWERYAMIKARVVAGPTDAADELTATLRPFVYRRYLDYGALESLRGLKAMIDRELRRKGMADNIKLGPGGIREVEFIGQAFQLIRGGRDPDLQQRPIQVVLRELERKGHLPTSAVDELIGAYRFLRRLENRIQAWQDRQTHLLPERPEDRARLARTMDCANWETFVAQLDGHRARVQTHFDGIFGDPEPERDAVDPVAGLWDQRRDPDQMRAALQAAGFADTDAALNRLEQFRETVARKGLSSRASERLGQLMPRLLSLIAASDAPDPVLERVLRVLEAVVGRTAYLDLLVEQDEVLNQLVRLSVKSPWFAARTARHPLLLDELLDPRRLYAPMRRQDLEAELTALLAPVAEDDLEQQMERLRQFAQGNALRVAAADLTGAIRLMVVSDYLTEIAEVSIAETLAIAWRDLVSRHGVPLGRDLQNSGFLILGYGKLGGIELGYNSDLDLVFLYDERVAGEMTDGPRPIAVEQFYVRLGQRILHIMSTPTYSGVLYEVDMRLRPDGKKGMIARSLASFAEYQAKNAWTWEHQALVRARPVAGDAALGARFEQVRERILRLERDADALRTDVRAMREKMRGSLDKSNNERFDLKQGRGGIADIEFMVQYSVLRWAHQCPDLTEWTDNIRLIATLHRFELLPGSTAQLLEDAYKALRGLYHRNALQDAPGLVEPTQLSEERDQVAGLWSQLFDSHS
jgi:glutamate-ammonia-ligase adenylyltransferase